MQYYADKLFEVVLVYRKSLNATEGSKWVAMD